MHLNFCKIGEMTDEELLQVYCLAPQALENKFTGSDWVDFWNPNQNSRFTVSGIN